MMKRITLAIAAGVALAAQPFATADHHGGGGVYELRTYTTHEGKLPNLHARFKNHTLALFEKHGMTVVGFWTPKEDGADNTLVYLLAYPSHEARSEAWKAFIDDPEWKGVYAESQKDGRLVAKVESKMLAPTDYSPMK